MADLLKEMVIHLCREGMREGGSHLLKEWQNSAATAQAKEDSFFNMLSSADDSTL